MKGWLHRRAHGRGLHGHAHVASQRTIALAMIVSGIGRVFVWTLLLVLYLSGVAFARNLFASVAFVAVLSVLALMLTDWGQVVASFAALFAADSHADTEHVRRELGIDTVAIETDLMRLADLQPGAEATSLAAAIRQRLVGE